MDALNVLLVGAILIFLIFWAVLMLLFTITEEKKYKNMAIVISLLCFAWGTLFLLNYFG